MSANSRLPSEICEPASKDAQGFAPIKMTKPFSRSVHELIEQLNLTEHPEGGWFRETYRSPIKTNTIKGERNLATLIYYLLPKGIESRVHRVSWDEIWIFQAGGVLELKSYDTDNTSNQFLGMAIDASPQIVIPAKTWFNAKVVAGEFVLAACLVAPGFEFLDLDMR